MSNLISPRRFLAIAAILCAAMFVFTPFAVAGEDDDDDDGGGAPSGGVATGAGGVGGGDLGGAGLAALLAGAGIVMVGTAGAMTLRMRREQ